MSYCLGLQIMLHHRAVAVCPVSLPWPNLLPSSPGLALFAAFPPTNSRPALVGLRILLHHRVVANNPVSLLAYPVAAPSLPFLGLTSD